MNKIVVGLGFGDEGKGATVDWLCEQEEVGMVVRYNGGSQCGHNVVRGRKQHCFSQFGSGTLNGVPTLLSKDVMVEPLALSIEADHLAGLVDFDPYSRLHIDDSALLTTPYHWILNRARETARQRRHGTCGRGIGETMRYAEARPLEAPRIRDFLRGGEQLVRKLMVLQEWARSEAVDIGVAAHWPTVETVMAQYRSVPAHWHSVTSDAVPEFLGITQEMAPIIFEGAQGVLLDQDGGFPPHNTWSNTTTHNAEQLMLAAGAPYTKIGVMRAYMTRHGQGPLPTEVFGRYLEERHNRSDGAQGYWRTGHLDFVMLRYALSLTGGVDEIALTHADVTDRSKTHPYVDSYANGSSNFNIPLNMHPVHLNTWLAGKEPRVLKLAGTTQFIADLISEKLSTPVTSWSKGPQARHRKVVNTVNA